MIRASNGDRTDNSHTRSRKNLTFAHMSGPVSFLSILNTFLCCKCFKPSTWDADVVDTPDDKYELVVEKQCVFKVPMMMTAIPEDIQDQNRQKSFPSQLTHGEESRDLSNSKQASSSSGQVDKNRRPAVSKQRSRPQDTTEDNKQQ